MAILSDSLRLSNLNLTGISNSLSSSQKTISTANSTVERLSRNIQSNTRIKKELIDRSSIIRSRRDEASRRQELEDQLESSKVSTDTRKGLSFASKSDLNPFGRLLGFLGFITAGWIMDNLPNWIFMGTEFIDRARRLGSYLPNMLSNLISISQSFTSVLSNSLTSILRLDFDEFSEGSVAKSFEGLQLSIEDLGTNITDTFKLFTTPLTQSLETGEQAPDLGEMREDTTQPQYPTSTQGGAGTPTSTQGGTGTGGGGNQTRASYGTKEQRAMLDAIAWAEGGVSYRTMFGGGQFDTSRGWNHPDTVVRSGGYASAAAGRYQFMPFTWARAAKALGLKDFSPINQDKAAIWLMDQRLGGNSAEILRSEGVSNRVLNAFSGEWAAVPMAGGGSYYGQPSRKVKDFKDKYQSLLRITPEQISSTQSSRQQQTPAITPQTPTTISTPQNFTGTFIQGSTGRSTGPHFHFGPGRANAKMAQQGNRFPGIYYSDVREVAFNVAKKFLNRRIGFRLSRSKRWINPGVTDSDLRSALLKEQKAHTSKGSDGGIDMAFANQVTLPLAVSDVKNYDDGFGISGTISGTNVFVGHGAQGSRSSIGSNVVTREQAQISPQPRSQQLAQITPERRGSQVTIIDDSQPVQQPQVPYISQQPTVTPTVHESKLLNNFIKNKLLLDLAYL